jgi:hypothetical protein
MLAAEDFCGFPQSLQAVTVGFLILSNLLFINHPTIEAV